MDNAASLIAINFLTSMAMQWMKNSAWLPWITHETETVNKLVAALAASLASAGMVVTISHSGAGGAGQFVFAYAGISVGHVVSFGYHALANYAVSKGIFKAFFASSPANGVKA